MVKERTFKTIGICYLKKYMQRIQTKTPLKQRNLPDMKLKRI